MNFKFKHLFGFILLFGTVLITAIEGCKKYDRVQPTPQASYLRVFNSTNTPSFFQDIPPILNDAPFPFITFLMDPTFDLNGHPNNGAVIGDFLGVSNAATNYFAPYPPRPGEKPVVGYTFNEDFPGTEPVLTAPVLNNLDLSRWAQISSGKHRIIFVLRSGADEDFSNLPLSNRRTVIIDTVVNFGAGGITTLQVVNDNINNPNHYKLNIRSEELTKNNFSGDKIYLNFFSFTSDSSYFPGAFDVYYQKYFDSLQYQNNTPILTPEKYLASVKKPFSTNIAADAPYVSIDASPRDSFLMKNGAVRPPNKRPLVILNFYRPGESHANNNTPLLSIPTGELYPNPNSSDPPHPQNGYGQSQLGPLQQVFINSNRINIYPLINTIQISTYMMYGSEQTKVSLITVQHPLGVQAPN